MERKSFGIRMEKILLAEVDDYAAEQEMTRSLAIEELVRSQLQWTTGKTLAQNQDQESGAAAAKWGRETAPMIAKHFGAVQIRPNVNEFEIDGSQIAIKTASKTNKKIGVYNTVRDRVTYIWGAFQQKDDSFDIYELTPKTWKDHAKKATPSSPNYGKLTFMDESTCRDHSCRKVGTLTLNLS
ncbi:CopG family ribbon-helix-helix protein [Kordiimonas sp.]|uniref:CopG family ribbon-helix-helix protein n=1 Tax=Kordiimonas sp. TaxID=1970157 RepID=UPI003B515894